jgi:hypothetical protein
MHVTVPVVGGLFLRPRLWAWRRVKAGKGRGRALHVALDAVEDYAGRRFTQDQLAAAGLHISPVSEQKD